MTDVNRDTDQRYLNDPAFRGAVATLERIAVEHGFTPGELKQIAFKAALNIEESRPIAVLGVRTQQGPVQTFTTPEEYEAAYPGSTTPRELFERPGVVAIPVAEVAGYLKDGTPVFLGRTP